MTEDKVKEFLDRLSACIEEEDLDACVGRAAVLTRTSRGFKATRPLISITTSTRRS